MEPILRHEFHRREFAVASGRVPQRRSVSYKDELRVGELPAFDPASRLTGVSDEPDAVDRIAAQFERPPSRLDEEHGARLLTLDSQQTSTGLLAGETHRLTLRTRFGHVAGLDYREGVGRKRHEILPRWLRGSAAHTRLNARGPGSS